MSEVQIADSDTWPERIFLTVKNYRSGPKPIVGRLLRGEPCNVFIDRGEGQRRLESYANVDELVRAGWEVD